MKKKCKVVALPAKEITNVLKINQGTKDEFVYNDNNMSSSVIKALIDRELLEFQHLYILSDDKIEIGDWVYNENSGVFKIVRINYPERQLLPYREVCPDTPVEYYDENNCKKIIATTDEKLFCFYCTKHGNCTMCDTGNTFHVAKISQSFLQVYCEKNGVDEADNINCS